MGLALPDDYDGSDPGTRAVFCYVNAHHTVDERVGGYVFRVDNDAVSPTCGPSGDPLLASMDIHGDADTGKMMIGTYMGWDQDDPGDPVRFECCEGVAVYHTEELDFCCPQWDGACKDPSGPYLALVAYTPDGDKAYATTSGALDLLWFDGPWESVWDMWDAEDYWGGLCDESAFSVSLDDGVSFNQLGLIDTDIDYLSDVAVCPDCGVIYLSTINEMECLDCGYCCEPSCLWNCWVDTCEANYSCLLDCWTDCLEDPLCFWDCVYEALGCGAEYECFMECSENCCEEKIICQVCSCDSVWRSYDNGDTWERVFHGDWTESDNDQLLLRLPCDAVEDCCDQDPVSPSGTIYLGLQYDDQVFYSRDCGQCWNEPPATKIDIQDMAVESENIVYILDEDGYVSKSTQYGRRWSDEVDTEVGSGHTIAACCEEGFVVVGGAGDEPVGWSDDGGETWNLTDDLPGTSSDTVHVACDPICENIIYAALSGPVAVCGGIYRTDVTDGEWANLEAFKYGYYGIVLAREGTLYAVSNNIHVDPGADICDRFVAPDDGYEVYSGVARNLTPCETECCGEEDWDYLICGLDTECIVNANPGPHCFPTEWFDNDPSDLRICGCLSEATNSVLYAIDSDPYDVTDGTGNNDEFGSLWSYEDCAAKAGPTLTSPANGAVLDCEACAGCGAAPFTLEWERMCEACSYDINIMDEDGNMIIELVDQEITGDPPELYLDPEAGELKIEIAGSTVTITSTGGDSLECGNTYTWKVREANTDCECVHSPWSETWSFTIAVGAADAIRLLAPDEGALGIPIDNIGFSWTSVPDASSYTFILSPNAALTGALVSQDLSSTAFNFAGPLDFGKAYYWQVKAWKDGILLTTSAIGVFNTGSKPVVPPPPVVVEPTPAPIVEIPPAEQITPTWIYAIIGIGCALAVVVIVLIVRTRRP